MTLFADRPVLQAVLFDLDGTLIDSEPVWGEAMRALWRSRGRHVSDSMLQRISGLDARLAMELMHREMDWDSVGIDRDLAFMHEKVSASYSFRLSWLPGARELLAAVQSTDGLLSGLVTSTYSPIVKNLLVLMGRPAFDVVVCGDEVSRSKPDPDPYTTAVERIGISPASCVAIEDSPRGVASARGAGCVVLQSAPRIVSDGADAWVPALTEVTVASLAQLVTGRTVAVTTAGQLSADDFLDATVHPHPGRA